MANTKTKTIIEINKERNGQREETHNEIMSEERKKGSLIQKEFIQFKKRPALETVRRVSEVVRRGEKTPFPSTPAS